MKNSVHYSRIIAGCMTWGGRGAGLSQQEAARLIQQCVDYGISTFDHADIYGGYTTEAEFGPAFLASGIDRGKLQLISKCGIQYPCPERPLKVKHYQYDAGYIIASVERSLKHLKTTYLDLLLLHRPSPLMHPEVVAEAISALQQSGKVLSFGVSNFSPAQMALIESAIPVAAHQFECALTAPNAMFNGQLDDCLIRSRTAMAWGPLGNFFKSGNGVQHERISSMLKRLCETYNASESQILLAWLLKHPSGIHPIIGTTKSERHRLAVKALDIDLELQDWFLLLEAAQGQQVP
jgi:predicted oxidoreductase